MAEAEFDKTNDKMIRLRQGRSNGVRRLWVAFGAATGRSIMRYVRGRRLTEAARSLADGAPDILAVALCVGTR
jgi:transcriptional regulator GlxA family with amidase domain